MENKKKKKKGFTLIELIAVIAILAILAAVLVPNVIGYQNKAKISKIKANARTVLNVINTAKANSDSPDAITTYRIATTGKDSKDAAVAGVTADATLIVNPAPSAALQDADVSHLESIISNTSTSYSDYSAYN